MAISIIIKKLATADDTIIKKIKSIVSITVTFNEKNVKENSRRTETEITYVHFCNVKFSVKKVSV